VLKAWFPPLILEDSLSALLNKYIYALEQYIKQLIIYGRIGRRCGRLPSIPGWHITSNKSVSIGRWGDVEF
jgi:hypothetical protein